jgi:hypothetical protein
MNELIARMMKETGMNEDQAAKAIVVIKDFVVEKFPVLAGAVDGIFAAGKAEDEDGL